MTRMAPAMRSAAANLWRRAELVRARLAAVSSLPGPPGEPLLGNLRQVPQETMHQVFEDWADTYGSVYRVLMAHVPFVIISDPVMIREVLRRRPDDFRRLKVMTDTLVDMGIDGVFAADGDVWRRQRRLVMPAFKRGRIGRALPMMSRVAHRLRDIWWTNVDQVRDIRADCAGFTADVTSLVAFGVDLDTLRQPSRLRRQIDIIFDTLGRRIRTPVPYWRYIKLSADRECDRALTAVGDTVRRILRAPPDDDTRATLLQGMREARLEEQPDRGLSEDELVANVLTILLAGEDTTASTLAWTIDALARYPAIQERMRAEVHEVLGERDAPMDLETAERLRYQRAVFQETLRVRSPTPFIYLESARQVRLGSLELPPGVPVIALTRHTSMAEDAFLEASVFRPERWLQLTREPPGFAPFGGGPRLCPGLHLALLESQVLLSVLLRHFRIEPARAAAPVERIGFTMQPASVPVRLTALTTAKRA